MTPHTPTRHASWRVIDGQLIDETTVAVPEIGPAAEPVIASTDVRDGGPDELVPPIDEPTPPAKRRRKESANGTA